MFEAVYPLPPISGTRQRLWMLVGKGRFQLTGVLMMLSRFSAALSEFSAVAGDADSVQQHTII